MAWSLAISFVNPPDMQLKAIKKATLDALEASGKHWKRGFLSAHFETSAPEKYGYRNRTKNYMLRKAKKMHHQQPLVWSGESKRIMLGQMPQIKKSGKSVSLVFKQLPWYFGRRMRRVDKHKEVTWTIASEAEKMAEIAAAVFNRALNRAGRKET